MLKNVVPMLLEKGLPVKPLFDSAVFRYTFEVDEWPINHYNDKEELRPFNDNIFLLNKFYKQVFPEQEFTPIEELSED
jgi:hypothetical protein